MKALSLAQASRCETAEHKTCKCRCGGALHGAKRPGDVYADTVFPSQKDYEQTFFETLPEEDPHHIRSKVEIAKRRRVQRAAAKHKQTGQQSFWPAEAR